MRAWAANPLDVVISEVAWAGTTTDGNDEWIELYNNTNADISLTNWVLVSSDSSPNLSFIATNCSNLTIPAKGFFLLERTDDTTISSITADCIYTGSLANGGESLTLKDASSNVIDTANGNGGVWPAGNSTTRSSMERVTLTASDTDSNWATNDGVHRNGLDVGNNPVNGTPKAPIGVTSYNSLDVVVSEIAWAGTGADSNDEWIELYNNTNQSITLTGWTLVAADGAPTIALSGTILANSFFVLERTDQTTISDMIGNQIYSGSLSNSGEALTLKDALGNTIDTTNGNGGAWPAGDDSTHSSMERIHLTSADTDTNWATNDGVHRNGLDAGSNAINGTPGAPNSTLIAPTVDITNPTSVSLAYAKQGSSFSVSFTTDKPGSYEIKINGTSCGVGSASAGGNTKTCVLPNLFSEGLKDISVTVIDGASLSSSDTETNALGVDNTPPTLSGISSPAANANGWNKTNVIVTFNCADSVSAGVSSGVTAGNPIGNITLMSDTAGTNVNGTCTDNAGNTNTISVGPIRIDKFPPKLSVLTPNGGELIYATNNFAIKWALCIDVSFSNLITNPIMLSYSTDGGVTYSNPIALAEANNGMFNWATPNIDTSQVRVKITCTDKADNVGEDTSNANFTLTTGLAVSLSKESTNFTTGSLLTYLPGETVQYTILLKNLSQTAPLFDNPGPEFTDTIGDLLRIKPLSATASTGTLTYDRTTRTYAWNGTLAPGASVTITIRVRIAEKIISDNFLYRFCNQARAFIDHDVNHINETRVLSEDPTPLDANTQTCLDILARPGLCNVILYPRCDGATLMEFESLQVTHQSNSIQFEALGQGIKAITVQIYQLSETRIYASGWTANKHQWMLTDTRNKRVANGIYLVFVSVRGYDEKTLRTQIEKIIVLK
jgi:uncharacterized repeat protein (TIGR01451 family)